jgi:hypothetical protein
MYRRSVEIICGISGMRKYLARPLSYPDGLLTRRENLPFGQKPKLTSKDNSEKPDYNQSRYMLDVRVKPIK